MCRNRRRPVTDLLADIPSEWDTEDRVLRMESTNAVIALIATLPKDQAEAVLLRVVVGLDVETAAQVMGKRAGAVRTAAWRGLRGLAKRLEQARNPKIVGDSRKGVTGNGWLTPRKVR